MVFISFQYSYGTNFSIRARRNIKQNKKFHLYYQVLPIEQKLQGSGFTFVLFLLCLHSLEVSCSQRQVLVARDLRVHYQKPEPRQRHGQPPSLTGFWALAREGTEALQLFP